MMVRYRAGVYVLFQAQHLVCNCQPDVFFMNVMVRWLSLRAIAFQEQTTPIRVVPQKF